MHRRLQKSVFRLCPGIIAVALALLSGCISLDADGNWFYDPPDFSSGHAWSEDMRTRIRNHDPTALRDFVRRQFDALHSTDPRDMEHVLWMLETVEAHAPRLPGMQEYASWIQSRKAYFEAAEAARQVDPGFSRLTARPPGPSPMQTASRLPDRERPTGPPLIPSPSVSTSGSIDPANFPRLKDAPKPPDVERTPSPPDGRRDRDYWQEAVKRHRRPTQADAMLPRIIPVFRDEGLPVELVWIAEVESTMDPAARSPVGARGLFQLMPRTATSLGLQLSPTDQRLEPEHNARAAARYLRLLHNRFGSWPLALAAYNAGQGRVAGLCRRHRTDRFDSIAAYLPNETQMYVPRVLETIRHRTGANPDALPPPLPR